VKILVADDDDASRTLMELMVSRMGYEVTSVRDGLEALDALLSPGRPHLALLDWLMPGMEGPEICRRVREAALEPYPYLVLVTSKRAREDLVAGLDAGADDYLTKPFDAAELEGRIRAGRRVARMSEELVAARERLRDLALHDVLTGILNRRAVSEHLERELSRARRESGPLAVVMVDLDHFKRVNDAHGHAAGDEVLREAARRLGATLRGSDAVGRFGGEEFLVVLPGATVAGAHESAERLRLAVSAQPVQAGKAAVEVTCSLGVAGWRAPRQDVDGLLAAADSALYRAKELGRNRVECAPPPDQGSEEASLPER